MMDEGKEEKVGRVSGEAKRVSKVKSKRQTKEKSR